MRADDRPWQGRAERALKRGWGPTVLAIVFGLASTPLDATSLGLASVARRNGLESCGPPWRGSRRRS